MKPKTISAFNASQYEEDQKICDRLRREIDLHLPEAESKIWHGHPVWFLDSNPTVGYSKLKDCIRLMFWSGADFDEAELKPGTGKFKDASAHYTNVDQINLKDMKRWLGKAKTLQWDYRGIQKRKGKLLRIS
ncbi:MAG: DUF1801 domain-containing protein [bacterium]